MTPRFETLMSSGSKTGTQIYHPFHSKSPGKRIPSRFPTGPLWRETPASRAFLRLFLNVLYLFLSFPQCPLHVP